MKEFLFIFIITVLSICHSFGQSFEMEFAREIVDELASPAYHGRGYVNKGEKKASKYISSCFKSFGLEAMNHNSYFQPFDLPVNTFPGSCELTIDDRLFLVPGKDFLVTASSPSIIGNYGVIKISELENVDQILKSVTRPIFLLFENNEISSKEAIDYCIARRNQYLAGLIITGIDKLTWSTSTRQQNLPVFLIKKSEEIVSSSIKTVDVNVKAKFIEEYESRNVIGFLEGESDSVVVISAHYDHLGKMGKRALFPGANDNASGIAQLLCLAKHFSTNKPKYSLAFIAFGGEEAGLIGSRFYVRNPLFPLSSIRFMLNLDIAGTGDEGIQIVNSTVFKTEYNTLNSLNKASGYLPNIKKRGGACNSDHCPFHREGVKSFFIYTLGGIQAYHDIYDRPETLPLTAFEACFELYKNFLEAL